MGLSLNLFWTDDASVAPVGVRDIYALEFQIFKNPLWSIFYIFSVCVFMTHYCIGWKKVTPVLGIPKGHIRKVEMIGYAIGIVMGLVYISFSLYVMLTTPFAGYETSIQNAGRVGASGDVTPIAGCKCSVGLLLWTGCLYACQSTSSQLVDV